MYVAITHHPTKRLRTNYVTVHQMGTIGFKNK